MARLLISSTLEPKSKAANMGRADCPKGLPGAPAGSMIPAEEPTGVGVKRWTVLEWLMTRLA